MVLKRNNGQDFKEIFIQAIDETGPFPVWKLNNVK